MQRKPSHFGSKAMSPSGMPSTARASIGFTGGITGRSTAPSLGADGARRLAWSPGRAVSGGCGHEAGAGLAVGCPACRARFRRERASIAAPRATWGRHAQTDGVAGGCGGDGAGSIGLLRWWRGPAAQRRRASRNRRCGCREPSDRSRRCRPVGRRLRWFRRKPDPTAGGACRRRSPAGRGLVRACRTGCPRPSRRSLSPRSRAKCRSSCRRGSSRMPTATSR